eukprot:gene13690-16177_t
MVVFWFAVLSSPSGGYTAFKDAVYYDSACASWEGNASKELTLEMFDAYRDGWVSMEVNIYGPCDHISEDPASCELGTTVNGTCLLVSGNVKVDQAEIAFSSVECELQEAEVPEDSLTVEFRHRVEDLNVSFIALEEGAHIRLERQLDSIARSLEVECNGTAGSCTIDGQRKVMIFDVLGEATVLTLRGLRLVNGFTDSSHAAAITSSDSAKIQLYDCWFENNIGIFESAAIYLDSTFHTEGYLIDATDCLADSAACILSHEIHRCTFANHTTMIPEATWTRAVISSHERVLMDIQNCTFYNNSVGDAVVQVIWALNMIGCVFEGNGINDTLAAVTLAEGRTVARVQGTNFVHNSLALMHQSEGGAGGLFVEGCLFEKHPKGALMVTGPIRAMQLWGCAFLSNGDSGAVHLQGLQEE